MDTRKVEDRNVLETKATVVIKQGTPNDSEPSLRRFLLRRTSQKERARIEERAFQEDAFFELLEAAEGDLIEAYSRGELSRKERRLFERHCMGSEDERSKVALARALVATADPPSQSATQSGSRHHWIPAFTPALGVALAVVALVAVTVMGIFVVVNEDEIPPQTALDPAPEPVPPSVAESSLPELSPENSYPIELQSQFLRGNDLRPQLSVPPGFAYVILQLGVERGERYESFQATVETLRGAPIAGPSDLLSLNPTGIVELPISAELFETGNSYLVTLRGLTLEGEFATVNHYEFEVRD